MATRSTITRQSSREAIRELQRSLIALGFNPGRVDGVLGRRTQAAIRDFQKANGLDADGKAGPQTQRALYSGTPAGPGKSGAKGGQTGAALATRLAEPPRLPQPRPEFQAVRPAPPPGTFPAAAPAPFMAQGVRPAPDPTLSPQALPRSINPVARGGPVSVPQAPRMSNMDIAREMRVQRARVDPPSAYVGNPQNLKQQVAEMKAAEFTRLTQQMAEQPHRAATIMAQIEALDSGSRPSIPAAPSQKGPMARPQAASGYTYAPSRQEQIADALRRDIRAGDLASQGEGMSTLRSKETPQATVGTHSPPAAYAREHVPDIYDKLRPKDIHDLAFTIAGEIDSKGTGGAAYGTPENRQEIADITQTIMNRSRDRGLTPSQVVTEGYGKQYNAWLTNDGRGNNPRRNSANALKKYGPDIYSALNSYFTGDLKPTNTRIDHYLNRAISNPKWSRPGSSLEPLAKINQHTFYGPRLDTVPFDKGVAKEMARGGVSKDAIARSIGVSGIDARRENQVARARSGMMGAPPQTPDPWASIASRTQLPTDPRVGAGLGSNRFTAPSISDLARGAMPADPRVGMALGSNRSALDRGSASKSGEGIFAGPFSQTSPYRTKDDDVTAIGGGRSVFDTAAGLTRELFGGNQRPPAPQQTAARYDPLSSAMPGAPRPMSITPRPVPTYTYGPPKTNIDQTLAMGKTLLNPNRTKDDFVGPAPIPVVAPPQRIAPPPVMAQAPIPTVPTAPPPDVPGAHLWSAIQRGAKTVGGAMVGPAIKAWISDGPTALAARASQARGLPGFWDQMGRVPGGPTDIARASFIAAQMFGGGQPRNERGQFTSGGNHGGGGNYGGGYGGGNYGGGGSRYQGPGSGGHTNKSGY